MPKNEIVLRPSYWASVSGGKDSLYMLKLILSNLDKYPLDGVCHFELEIDYPFIHDVIDYMESECKKFGIPFMRFKPRTSWNDLYDKQGFPTKRARWCNSQYKMDGRKQLDKWLKSLGYYTVTYIGYCADEEKRFKSRNRKEIYPLAEYGILESTILEWAKNEPIFNNYYKTNKRCGCMYCPMASRMEYAYLYKYYPDNFDFMIEKMKDTEKRLEEKYGRKVSVFSGNPKYDADYLDNNIKTKWINILEELERGE